MKLPDTITYKNSRSIFNARVHTSGKHIKLKVIQGLLRPDDITVLVGEDEQVTLHPKLVLVSESAYDNSKESATIKGPRTADVVVIYKAVSFQLASFDRGSILVISSHHQQYDPVTHTNEFALSNAIKLLTNLEYE